jgi:hypothetical protein
MYGPESGDAVNVIFYPGGLVVEGEFPYARKVLVWKIWSIATLDMVDQMDFFQVWTFGEMESQVVLVNIKVGNVQKLKHFEFFGEHLA